MAKDIRFVLKDYKSPKAVMVSLKYQCDDCVLKYSTGHKITVIDWHAGRFYKALDRKMAELKTYVDKYIQRAEKAGESVLGEELANYLRRKEGKAIKVVEKGNLFFEQLKILINDARIGKQPIYNGVRMGGLYGKGTLKHWDLAYNKLFEFNPNLSWNITMKDYNNFIAWCNQKDQNFRPNYIGTIIKMWKVFMNLGLERGWHNNHVHLQKGFRKLTAEKIHKVYLNTDEIKALMSVPLQGMQKEIRDRFVINLNLSLRISDMKEISEENFVDGIINSVNRKTGAITSIPANGDILTILAERGGFPRSYPEQTINREIKKIAELAGITQTEEYSETVGGVEMLYARRKCDMISNHTARRSFITNKLKQGVSVADVAKFAGSTIKNVEKYNKETIQEVAKRYIGHDAFK